MTKIMANSNKNLSDKDKKEMISKLEENVKEFLHILHFDVENDQQIKDTPKRVAKMFVNELFGGCYTEEPKLTVFKNEKQYDDMVYLGNIAVKSTCSHHLMPFIGVAHVAYIPGEYVCGISKLARIVRWFMRRPQIQEELTKQVADFLTEKLNAKGVAVYIEASHMCMVARGVEENNNAKMVTSALRGIFLNDNSTKHEFLNMIHKRS